VIAQATNLSGDLPTGRRLHVPQARRISRR
jgi:hypothetical protein